MYCVTALSCSFLSVQREEQILSDTSVRLVAENELFEKMVIGDEIQDVQYEPAT
jgi:hypothetical protein